MHIVLLILKILGMILLGILGLLLAVILIVLLVPIRYQLYGKRERETGVITASGKVSWLLSIFSLRFSYDQELQVGIHIFGRRLGQKENKSFADEPAENQSYRMQPVPEKAPYETSEEIWNQGRYEDTSGCPDGHRDHTQKEAPVPGGDPHPEKTQKSKKKSRIEGEAGSQKEPIPKESPLQSLRIKAAAFRQSVSRKKDQGSEILNFLQSEEVQGTLRLLWRQIRRILRHLLPQKIWLRLRFGLKDPAQTGQVVALMSMLPFFYQKGIAVTPVFDEACFDGEAAIKGRIRIGTCFGLALRIVCSRHFWKLLKSYRAITNQSSVNHSSANQSSGKE